MSEPDPIDPITLLMAQLAVQNIVIEYLLATITGSLDLNQKESVRKALLNIMRGRISESTLNSSEMLKMSEDILEGMLVRMAEMQSRGSRDL